MEPRALWTWGKHSTTELHSHIQSPVLISFYNWELLTLHKLHIPHVKTGSRCCELGEIKGEAESIREWALIRCFVNDWSPVVFAARKLPTLIPRNAVQEPVGKRRLNKLVNCCFILEEKELLLEYNTPKYGWLQGCGKTCVPLPGLCACLLFSSLLFGHMPC